MTNSYSKDLPFALTAPQEVGMGRLGDIDFDDELAAHAPADARDALIRAALVHARITLYHCKAGMSFHRQEDLAELCKRTMLKIEAALSTSKISTPPVQAPAATSSLSMDQLWAQLPEKWCKAIDAHMQAESGVVDWRVGEFRSETAPGETVLNLQVGSKEIAEGPNLPGFIRWVGAGVRPKAPAAGAAAAAAADEQGWQIVEQNGNDNWAPGFYVYRNDAKGYSTWLNDGKRRIASFSTRELAERAIEHAVNSVG